MDRSQIDRWVGEVARRLDSEPPAIFAARRASGMPPTNMLKGIRIFGPSPEHANGDMLLEDRLLEAPDDELRAKIAFAMFYAASYSSRKMDIHAQVMLFAGALLCLSASLPGVPYVAVPLGITAFLIGSLLTMQEDRRVVDAIANTAAMTGNDSKRAVKELLSRGQGVITRYNLNHAQARFFRWPSREARS